jgi:hypothetical protein
VARKRKGKQKVNVRSAAYRAGLARGRALEQARRHRLAVKAGKKSGAVRRAKAKAPPKPPPEAVAVGEVVLYESTPDDAALFHLEWREFPVIPTRFVVRAAILADGEVEQEEEIAVEPEWDKEAAAATVRRQLRAFVKDYNSMHPEKEGYQAVIFRLSLRALSGEG